MTSSTDPVDCVDGQLRDLLAHGYEFFHPTGQDGGIVAVVGVRAHHNVIDVVCLRGEGDAKAARMPADEDDFLAPTRTLWQRTGAAVMVLAALLALPDEQTFGSVLRTWEPDPDREFGPRQVVRSGASLVIDAN